MHIREVLWVPMIPTHEADIIRIFSSNHPQEQEEVVLVSLTLHGDIRTTKTNYRRNSLNHELSHVVCPKS
jgi:hypothetical protein